MTGKKNHGYVEYVGRMRNWSHLHGVDVLVQGLQGWGGADRLQLFFFFIDPQRESLWFTAEMLPPHAHPLHLHNAVRTFSTLCKTYQTYSQEYYVYFSKIHILLIKLLLKLCDCFSGGPGLLCKSVTFGAKLNPCSFSKKKIHLDWIHLRLHKKVLQQRKMKINVMSKYKALCQCECASYTHLALLQFRL